MAQPSRKGIKGWILNQLEARGYLLLNTRKTAQRDTWLSDLGIATVLDVGANRGESALELHHKLPKAQVVSFEPLPDSFAAMEQNLRGKSWWRGFNLAAGPENGESEIHRSEYSLSSSLLPMADRHKENFPYSAGTFLQKIQVGRLDDVLEDHAITGPYLLKLDVQGFELPALQGAARTLDQTKIIICETAFEELYVGQKLFHDTAAFLTERGFYYAGCVDQRLSTVNGKPLYQDAIYIKDDRKG